MADTAVMEVRKRKCLDSSPVIEVKKAKFDYYITVESDSFLSDYEAESVCSLQGKETDLVKDTTDTSDSDGSPDIEIEYELATTDEENDLFDGSSSGTEDFIATAGAIAAICETSLETWATGGEESDNSSSSSEYGLRDFRNCIQCKSENNNPQYRYCEKCFQLRKNSLPPRPRVNRVSQKKQKLASSDDVDSCSAGLSQDSGIGRETIEKLKTENRQELDNALGDSKELCIICNNNPKNSIFLHGSIAHMCCCYICSMKTWKTNKRCPMCNCRIKNVVKVFTN